jgi:enolase
VSLAVAKAAAEALECPLYRYIGGANAHTLPVPMMNILNGGAHADNNVDIQEFMVMPVGARRASKGLRMGTEVFHAPEEGAEGQGPEHRRGRRGRLRADLKSNVEAIEVILQAIKDAGYEAGKDIWLAIDAAASEFYKEGRYTLESAEAKPERNANGMVEFWSELCAKYPIISIEDGLDENDWDGWKKLTDKLGAKVQLVGDDLFVTNTEYLGRGIREGHRQLHPREGEPDRHAHRDAGRLPDGAPRAYTTVISHRSGETEDSTIADIAVATERGPDQDRLRIAQRPHRKVQPAAPHRRAAGQPGRVFGPCCVL